MAVEYKVAAARAERIGQLNFDPSRLPYERISSCDLCGNGVFRIIARTDRYGFANTYQLCEFCGLVFQNPRPTQEGYAKFYRSVYRPLVSAFKGKIENPQTMQSSQRSYGSWLTAFLVPYLSRVTQAVDLGGSTGIVADAMKHAFGGEWLVVDPAPDEVEVALSLGIKAEVGTAENWQPGSRRFDLILICRSIDHCLSITSTLEKVRDALTHDGLFFIDFVDFGCLAKVNEDFRRYLKIDHAFYLSDETMRAYFAKVGFEVVALDASVYQCAYLVKRGDTRPYATNGHASTLGAVLRERILAPEPKPYPVDLLTRLARALKRGVRR